MTDRHLHCVYFQFKDPNKADGYCLLKKKYIDYGFYTCCEDIVLRPIDVLMYYLKHSGECMDWDDANKVASDYIGYTGFNIYPKIQ